MEVFINVEKGVILPSYATDFSSGMDVHAYFDGIEEAALHNRIMSDGFAVINDKEKYVIVRAGSRILIPTGIRVAIPAGYEIQVRPRSGLAFKTGISVLNTPGTIDADYRGEIGVILINHSNSGFRVSHGDKIAQIVMTKVESIDWKLTEELPVTKRGEGGFGSTDKKPATKVSNFPPIKK
jgi:dUTP pyrophosphatase